MKQPGIGCSDYIRLFHKYNGIVVLANGDCTPLYYHIQECDTCEEMRFTENETMPIL